MRRRLRVVIWALLLVAQGVHAGSARAAGNEDRAAETEELAKRLDKLEEWSARWSNGRRIESRDKLFRLKFGGRIQADYATVDLSEAATGTAELSNVTLGVNWCLNPATRLMLNYLQSKVDTVGDIDAVLVRWQVDF